MNLFEWAFSKSLTPQERVKKNLTALERTQRELEREKRKLEVQEKKIIQDIKKSAKNGQIGAARIQAKDLVRTKRYIEKFGMMKIQLQVISLRIQAVRSNDQMATSMREVTGLLAGMNRSMNLPQLQRISMEFEKQSDMMDQRQEFMEEAIDEVMGDEFNDNAEADEIVNRVLDEIGVDLSAKLESAPQGIVKETSANDTRVAISEHVGIQESQRARTNSNTDDELQARLNSLKKV
ncbi:HBR002Cp [Eremothecium sinecaudum]|uniref:HBR002Cp n=1 Tax=Eremothecium sinecaudum TaxID=45286 RepID=A0A109UWL1_9SACH|nr:HBR002Cp [Eremothecium sinecaudum]AMD18903.1 HBR002Cp [Eremothecium sinecaudum]